MSSISLIILLLLILGVAILYSSFFKGKEEKERKGGRSMAPPLEIEEFSKELAPFFNEEKKTSLVEEKEENEALKSSPSLPFSYGKEILVAMVRDPHCIYSYWDYGPAFKMEGLPLLRLIDCTAIDYNGYNANNIQEIPVSLEAKNYYLHRCLPDRDYCLELGYRDYKGDFISLIRSNTVRTPRDCPSGEIESQWIAIRELYEESHIQKELGGLANTAGFVEELKKRREREMASPGFPWGQRR